MAKAPPRRTGPRTGGRLALFEVLQAQTPDGDAPAAPAAPMVAAPPQAQPTTLPQRVSAPTPQPAVHVYAPPQPAAEYPRGGPSLGQVGAAAGAVLCVALAAGAFFFGRMSAGASDDAATPTEIVPEALAVGDPSRGRPAPPAQQPAASVLKTQTAQISQQRPPITRTGPAQRVAGTNYLLVQSYATSERDRAEATIAALHAAGIDATIETGIKGWPNKLCIFGTESFERVRSNPTYNAYLARVKAVGASNTDRKIKRFDPVPVRWSH